MKKILLALIIGLLSLNIYAETYIDQIQDQINEIADYLELDCEDLDASQLKVYSEDIDKAFYAATDLEDIQVLIYLKQEIQKKEVRAKMCQ